MSELTVPFVDLKQEYVTLKREIDDAVSAVLERTSFILGAEVSSFESEFATYCETEYAVGVDSGTAAIELALRALGVGPGDEVITAANTFIATAFAISHTGATPVLVDVDPKTFTMNPKLIEGAVTDRTRAVIPVHLYGQPADMEPILSFARDRDLWVVEDASQAHGARYNGRRVGAFGDAAAFSCYPSKNLGAYGDAGIIVTSDEEVLVKIRMLRDQGQAKKHHHELIGHNHRLDEIQAAILNVKLKYLDRRNASRIEIAARYRSLLHGLPLVLPEQALDREAVYHLFVVRSKNRDDLKNELGDRSIGTGIHYPIPIHLQPAYAHLGYERGDFPVAEMAANEILSLPMFPTLDPQQIEYVAQAIATSLERIGSASPSQS